MALAVPVILRELQSGQVYECVTGQSLTVGRQAELSADDPSLAPAHAELRLRDDGLLEVRETGGSAFLNGQRVPGRALARPGDLLRFGEGLELVVADSAGEATMALPSGQGPGLASGDMTVGAGAPLGTLPGLTPGEPLGGRYRLERELGRGGAGVVLLAADLERGQPCAVKVLRLQGDRPPSERFYREAQVAKQLGDHPRIVKVRDWGQSEVGQLLYLVMDYVDGAALGHVVRQGLGRLRGVRLVRDAAQAVAFAHGQGVLHRDLKPDNVLVSRDHQVHLTDFGLAKLKDSVLTGTGDMMGTPNYLPPEQLEDAKRVTPASDVYGLGGTLYYVLTGRPPYHGQSLAQILAKVAAGHLVPPSEHTPGLEPGLERTCLAALSVDPNQRQPSAEAFARELDAWLLRARESDR